MSSIHNHHQQTGPNDQPPAARSRLAGDESRLFIAHANRLRRTVARAVNTSAANLDDACAFAWAQLVNCQPRRETVFPWLVRVASREAIRLDGRDRRTDPIDDELGANRSASKAGAEERLLLLETIEGLDAIHPRRRRMLLLHTVGFTSEEIAAECGINPSRVRALVYKARLQLREIIGDRGTE